MLRPEPGNAVTMARAGALGLETIRLPLFRVVPRAWQLPDPAGYDALLLTSANAVRHAGPNLAHLLALPVCAVGVVTADAARERGLRVWITGTGGVAALLADAANAGVARALHLTGEDRTDEDEIAASIVAARAIVYAGEAVRVEAPRLRALAGSVALLHSTRAALRFAELIDSAMVDREMIGLAALSVTILAAAGHGWGHVAVAGQVTDDALLAAAYGLAAAR